jgi:ABC-2 type transport system ATP-binding protein
VVALAGRGQAHGAVGLLRRCCRGCILLALLGDPAVIVLDEAFNGLDPASALVVKHHLQHRLSERHCAVLLATHSLDIVEHYADKAALLIDGRIVREWNEIEIAAYRVQGNSAMETALAAASN